MHKSELKSSFSESLLSWHLQNQRKLPWKASRDPYKIWVSEIILQQTRVRQGIPYYLSFIEKFPTIVSLANATEDELFQVWEGLGYYSRARNMHSTAKFVYENLGGILPNNYTDLLTLKGIGPYTAAAISSFAFDEPRAVVDGNVIRVLSRIFGIDLPFDTSEGKKIFSKLANELMDPNNSAAFNQAIMDFGALQCIPNTPTCSNCPFYTSCSAYRKKAINSYPLKSKKRPKKERYFIYMVFQIDETKTLIQKRTQSDIWKGLYQFPLFESSKAQFEEALTEKFKKLLSSYIGIPGFHVHGDERYKQSLSHQNIHSRFIGIIVKDPLCRLPSEFNLVDYENLCNFAFPKSINRFIEEKLIPL